MEPLIYLTIVTIQCDEWKSVTLVLAVHIGVVISGVKTAWGNTGLGGYTGWGYGWGVGG